MNQLNQYDLLAEFPLQTDEKILFNHLSKPMNYLSFWQVIRMKSGTINSMLFIIVMVICIILSIIISTAPDSYNQDEYFYLRFLPLVFVIVSGVFLSYYYIYQKELKTRRFEKSEEILSHYQNQYIITNQRVLSRHIGNYRKEIEGFKNPYFIFKEPDKFSFDRDHVWSVLEYYDSRKKKKIDILQVNIITPPNSRYDVFDSNKSTKPSSKEIIMVLQEESCFMFDCEKDEFTQEEFKEIGEILIPDKTKFEEIYNDQLFYIIQNPYDNTT